MRYIFIHTYTQSQRLDWNALCSLLYNTLTTLFPFQGAPFETMPRLRVLSMRNNHLRTIKERTFRNLRGNIAILDVDGK